MDIEAVLQSVQERDKWRRRLELLTENLSDVRARRRRTESRLRNLRSEMRRLGAYSDAVLDHARHAIAPEGPNASTHPRLPAR